MFIFLSIIPFLLYLLFSIKNKHMVYFFPIFIVCAILMGGNIGNPDTGIYFDIYYDTNFFMKDVGFGALVYISKNLFAFSFDEFRFITYSSCLLLLFYTVCKNTDKPYLFLLLFLSYQFFMQTVYFRNFVALCIFCFAFFNLNSKSLINIIFRLMLFTLACLIQKSFLFIIGIYFISYFLVKSKLLCFSYIVLSLILGILINFDWFYETITNLLSQLNLSGLDSFLERVTNLGRIINWGLAFLNLLLMYFVYNKGRIYIVDYKSYSLIKKIYYLNISGLCALFLYVLNPTFGRMLDNIIFLSFFAYCIFLRCFLSHLRLSKKLLIYFVVFILLIGVFYIRIINEGYFESIFLNLFNNNWIIFGGQSEGIWVEDKNKNLSASYNFLIAKIFLRTNI